MANEQPCFHYFTLGRTFKSYNRLKRAYGKLERFFSDFGWMNIKNVSDIIDWTQVPIVRL